MASVTPPLRLVFLGCGFITRVHSRHLRALRADVTPYYASRERARADDIVARVAAGQAIALISDAGTPLLSDPGFPLTIGKNCTIGHNVILHGCTIEDGALIGMGAIVMNGARIRSGCVVGAGAVITEGKEFPERSLIIGAPARAIRTLEPAQVEAMTRGAGFYVANGARFKKGLRKIG